MRLIFFSILFCYSFYGFSQSEFCGTSVKDQQTLLAQAEQYKSFSKRDGGFIYVPLMVHNVSNDNSSGFYAPWNLFETLCTLNEDFKPSGIQFYLEKDFNYIKNSAWNDHAEFSTGEEMMYQSNVQNMANCYLVSNPAGNCGYFTYNGDGVALSKSCLGKRSHTWAHELGHYFSLPHTFFGWEGIQYSSSKKTSEYQSRVFTAIENVNRDYCKNQADRFCDTEPDYISNRWTCNTDGFSNSKLLDTKDSTFRVDGSLYMSYANDDCMSRFSSEQMDAMNRNLDGQRSYLKRSNVVPKYINVTSFDLQFPEDSMVVPTRHVTFSWDKVPNAKYYILQISRTESFSIIIKNLLLNEPTTEIDSLIQGKNYWWRVRAFSEFDFCGAESQVGFFKSEPIITSLDETKADQSYLVPNPVSSYGNVQINLVSANQNDAQIEIKDLNGKSFRPFSIINNPNSILINLGYLPEGLYFLTARFATSSKVYKMIVKND